MKSMRWASIFCLGLVGCAAVTSPNGQFLELSAVSTQPGFAPPRTPGASVGRAKERYCATDESLLKRSGFVDHLVAQALKRDHADYITDAKFHFVDENCMEMIGEVRLKAAKPEAQAAALVAPGANGSALRPVPGLEIVGQNNGLAELSNAEGVALKVGQVFQVIDGAGVPRGEVKVEKVIAGGAWARVKNGKAFYGWHLVDPTAKVFAKTPTMPSDPAQSSRAPTTDNPLRFEVTP